VRQPQSVSFQTTLDTRRYALDKWMYRFFGDKLLANIHNAAMEEFVNHIAACRLRPFAIT
jgi:hypothetical protein